jgi:AraC-like DNA-binding protein
MATPLLARYRLLRTTDQAEAEEFVCRAWERHRSAVRRGRYGLSWHQTEIRGSCLAYVETSAAERNVCEGPHSDVFRIGFHDSGRIEHRVNGRQAASTPAQGVLHAPGQDLSFESEPFRMLFLALPKAQVQGALSRHFTSLPPFETWVTELPLDCPAVQGLSSLCRWAAAELDRPGCILLRSPRSCASLERTLLSLLVDCLAERHPDAAQRAADLAEAQVRLVEDWMEANLTKPLGVDDLAAMANVSARSLQLAFRRLRGCSPMQALMQRRLAFARRLLEHAGPGVNVTSVAMDLGFFNLGRFSVRYRNAFGEAPSATLDRCRRLAS